MTIRHVVPSLKADAVVVGGGGGDGAVAVCNREQRRQPAKACRCGVSF